MNENLSNMVKKAVQEGKLRAVIVDQFNSAEVPDNYIIHLAVELNKDTYTQMKASIEDALLHAWLNETE